MISNPHGIVRLAVWGFILLVSSAPAVGQSAPKRDQLELRRLAREKNLTNARLRSVVDSLSTAWHRPPVTTDSSGTILQLVGVERGRPVFYSTHNRSAALSTGVSDVWVGGRSGLDLSGKDIRIGIWDGGGVRLDHIEFENRVTQRDTVLQVLNHSTHVAGTLIAAGHFDIVRGMAYEAILDARDWNNDAAEMALAAATGLTLSNHSYGQPAGWVRNVLGDGLWGWMGAPDVDAGEDFKFGFYGEQAHDWDAIVAAAPDYLIVKSAGNEREDSGARVGEPYYLFTTKWELTTVPRMNDGGVSGFDTITDSGVSKNVLTVGAVGDLPWGYRTADDVKMTGFSGWGPTDDGRIKPDLVSNGVQLMSTMAWASDAYGTSTGTSMAAPTVTGSAALLTELYRRTHGNSYPSASLLKGVLIHTAREAGDAPGPDYRFGWGMIDVASAAAFLNASTIPGGTARIEEETLSGTGSRSFSFSLEPGDEIRATLTWTDPAADAGTPALDSPISRLIHDLDLSVTGPDGELLPWVLDPSSPTSAANHAINHRDNVEQVAGRAVTGGTYTATVSGSQIGTQAFTLLIGSITTPEIAQTYSISGRLSLGGVGLNRIDVRLSGGTFRTTSTTPDGVYSFANLEPGSYTVTPQSAHVTFPTQAIEVQVIDSNQRADFEADSGYSLLGYELFSGPNLLHANEGIGARPESALAPGGVYGASVLFNESTTATVPLGRGRVELEFDFDPNVTPYIGLKADRLLELSPDWTIADLGGGRLVKRIPLLWISSDTPPGHLVRIPVRVAADDEQLVLVDTLRIPVTGSDRIPPVVFLEDGVRGPESDGVGISVSFLEGSGLVDPTALFVDRFHPARIIQQARLYDDGDLGGHRDAVAGDGLYGARFLATTQNDIRMDIRVSDGLGNEIVFPTDRFFSGSGFEKKNSLLLLADSESESATEAHLSALAGAGVPSDFWETDIRGPIRTELLNSYDVVIRSLHDAKSVTNEQVQELSSLISSGKDVLVLGERMADFTNEEWRVLLHIDVHQSNEGLDRIAGIPVNEATAGFLIDLSRTSSVSALTPTGSTEPLLVGNPNEDQTAAYAFRVGGAGVVVSTVTAGSISGEEESSELLQRLLFASTGDLAFVPDVREVNPLFPANGDHVSADSVTFSWERSGFATYDLEVDTTAQFTTPVQRFGLTVTDVRMQIDTGKTYRWRIRATNPKGPGAWSETRTFYSIRPNSPPEIAIEFEDLILGEGQAGIIVPFSSRFFDPEGDPLQFSVANSDSTIVRVSVSTDSMEILPRSSGESRITVTALDDLGASSSAAFTVHVTQNHAPAVKDSPTDRTLVLGFTIFETRLDSIFTDPDDDALRFSVSSDDPSIVSVLLSSNVLRVTPMLSGAARVSMTATDGRGGASTAGFDVLVKENLPPGVVDDVGDIELLAGVDSVLVDLSDRFTDPDDSILLYSARSTNSSIIQVQIVARQSVQFIARHPGNATVFISAEDIYHATVVDTVQISVKQSLAATRTDENIPSLLSLEPPFPNPFSEMTTIVINLPAPGQTQVDVYSVLGRRVKRLLNRHLDAGSYTVKWRPGFMPDGVYYILLSSDDGKNTRKVVLLK